MLKLAPRTAVSVRELFALTVTRNPTIRRIHEEQIAAMLRMLPISLIVNLLNSVLLSWAVWDQVSHLQLGLWLVAVVVFCVMRAVRLLRLRQAHSDLVPASHRRIVLLSALMGCIWLAPPLLWFSQLDAPERMVTGILLAGMMCGGSITLAVVPLAAIAYILVLAGGALVIGDALGSPHLMAMILIFATALCAGAINTARLFVGHVKAQLELVDSSAMIELLRELGSSGSEWLWELAPDLTVRHMSAPLMKALDRSPEQLIGMHAVALLDPQNRVAEVSEGMRTLIECLRGECLFRDIAIPARDGRAWWSLSGKPLYDADGRLVGWRGVGSDITASRLSGANSVTAARHDVLTGLANRLLIRELLEEALLLGQRGRGNCALMLVDLDRFKLVNDTLGHSVGDELLCEVARRLSSLTPDVRVGRLGGDEFALVLTGYDTAEELAKLAETTIIALSAPYRVGQSELNIGATIGIAQAPVDGPTQEELIRSADLALYSAKKAGRGSFRFFAAWMAQQAAENRALESDLRSALKHGELSLAYQPIVHARSHKVIAREALLRWSHPVRGDVPPDVFVPVIEDAGLIGQVGNWVLREACREAAGWLDGARVAVNVSSAQLAAGPALVGHVIQALAASGLEAERLEIEVTESIFLANDVTTRTTLGQLRAIGVRLVLDDFGMGYASFSCLTNGEFSKIKIDRSFTVAAAQPGRPPERSIVESILTLARGLQIEVTAEGIETPEQAALMVALGCGQLQGYLFGRPAAPIPRPQPSACATVTISVPRTTHRAA